MHRSKNSKANRQGGSARQGGLRQRLSWLRLTNCVGGASITMLALLALVFITPSVVEGASAESANIPVAITSEAYLSLAADGVDGATMTVTPAIGGSFVSTPDIKLNVATNNPTGYKLVMATETGETALVNNKNNDKIMSIAGSVAENQFPKNTWGYQLTSSEITNTNYHGIPSGNLTLDNYVPADGTETYHMHFAAQLDATKSGTYTNTLVFSAVANPQDVTTLMDITKMQEMTTRICEDTPVDATRQLQDTRDNKWYWVAKLRDGNCWMVQNLAYDITQERIDNNEINPTNTDVSEVWNASSAYPPVATITSTNFNVDLGIARTNSWNLGEWILTDPTDGATCGAIGSGGNLADCNRLEAWNGNQDSHYLIGNYYSWNAATAGTGASITSGNAPSSICPKGWELPLSGEENKEISGSFYYLLEKYGLQNEVDNQATSVLTTPFYFTYSGVVHPYDKALKFIGNNGNYWSRTAKNTNTNNANSLSFTGPSVYPYSSNWRWTGLSIRCIAH